MTILDDSMRLSRASSETGSVTTTISQAQMQAGMVFDSTDALLKLLTERVRNFARSSTSKECALLREDLQSTRRSIIPYDENKLTPELQEQRRRLANQLDALSLQLTARTDALEGIIPSGPHITPEHLWTGEQSTR